MALVSCNLCGQKISTRAKCCPKCGCPTLPGERSGQLIDPACRGCGLADTYCSTCSKTAAHTSVAKAIVAHGEAYCGIPGGGLEGRIDRLPVDQQSKELFRKLAAAPPKRVIWGIPFFAGGEDLPSPWIVRRAASSLASGAGLLLGPVQYLRQRVWKKGTLLLVLELVLIGICSILCQGCQPLLVIVAGALPVHLLAGLMFRFDHFRTLVLEENFWW